MKHWTQKPWLFWSLFTFCALALIVTAVKTIQEENTALKVLAAPQTANLSMSSGSAIYPMVEYWASIEDDTELIAPAGPPNDEIGMWMICSPSDDHYLYWPSNFISAPPSHLRKSTCIAAEFVYDGNTQQWWPVSAPIIFEAPNAP